MLLTTSPTPSGILPPTFRLKKSSSGSWRSGQIPHQRRRRAIPGGGRPGPHLLPSGRRAHHGRRELTQSNGSDTTFKNHPSIFPCPIATLIKNFPVNRAFDLHLDSFGHSKKKRPSSFPDMRIFEMVAEASDEKTLFEVIVLEFRAKKYVLCVALDTNTSPQELGGRFPPRSEG